MKSVPTEVLIVGGGIGGLASALSIARAGHSVLLVEQAPEFSEVGAGLQLGPNALRAFDNLGVYDEIAKSAVFPDRAIVRDAITAETLTTLQFGKSFERRYGYPYVVAHRSDVLTALLDACYAEPRIRLENNRRVIAVTQDHETATVTFADGETATASLVVGADGIRSQIRQIIDTVAPTFSGHVAYRGALPIAQLPEPPDLDSVLLWIGPGMHLMQYPVRGGQMYNQVAVYERPEGQIEPTGSAEELKQAFAGTCDQVKHALEHMNLNMPWPIWDRVPMETWHRGRSVLVGDAAHAMLQYLGQGACQALEDAIALGSVLSNPESIHDPHAIEAAFQTYEQIRQPVAHRCQTVARPWGAVWHSQDPTVVALRDRVFRARRPDDYEDLDWLYAEHAPEKDNKTDAANGSLILPHF